MGTRDGQKLSWAALSDVGRKRAGNEDAFVVDPDLGVYVVCDGMGGHASGEVASAMTAEEIHAFYTRRDGGERALSFAAEPEQTLPEVVVANAIKRANEALVVASAADPALAGMGTTVVALVEHDDLLVLAHVGDSRVYRFSAGRLEQVTRDHSLLNLKIDLGEIRTQAEVDAFQLGNVIVRAVGLRETVSVETAIAQRVPGDIYLLCSDGLTDMVEDEAIEAVLDACQDDLDEAVQQLVDMANTFGGRDNITAVLVRVDDDESVAPRMRFKPVLSSPDDHTAPGRPVFAFDDDDEGDAERPPPPLRR